MRQILTTGPTRPGIRRLPPLDTLGGSAFDALALSLNPLMFLPGSDLSGTTAADLSGLGHTGTYSGTPGLGAATLATGDPTTAVDYDGTDDFITVARGAWMDVTNITICAIIKPDVVNVEQHILTRDNLSGTPGNRAFQFCVLSTAKLRFVPFSGGSPLVLDASTSLVAGTRYFVAATFDGATARIRLNKTQDGSGSLAGNLDGSTAQPIYIGQTGVAGNNRFFNGVMQKHLVYGSRLSDAALDALATAAGF